MAFILFLYRRCSTRSALGSYSTLALALHCWLSAVSRELGVRLAGTPALYSRPAMERIHWRAVLSFVATRAAANVAPSVGICGDRFVAVGERRQSVSGFLARARRSR